MTKRTPKIMQLKFKHFYDIEKKGKKKKKRKKQKAKKYLTSQNRKKQCSLYAT